MSHTEFKTIESPSDALDWIHDLLDGQEWTPDTLNEIADILRRAGYTVRDPEVD